MVLQSRREYLEAIRKRYRKAPARREVYYPGEFCATCGYNRKYAIRLLRKKKSGLSSSAKPGPDADL